MDDSYGNAVEVLPPELLGLIKQHCDKRHLYVSTFRMETQRRNRFVCRAFATGLTAKQIARLLKLSERRVWQILKESKEGDLR